MPIVMTVLEARLPFATAAAQRRLGQAVEVAVPYQRRHVVGIEPQLCLQPLPPLLRQIRQPPATGPVRGPKTLAAGA